MRGKWRLLFFTLLLIVLISSVASAQDTLDDTNVILDAIKGVMEFVGDVLEGVLNAVRSLADFIVNAIGLIIRVIGEVLSAVLGMIENIIRLIVQLIQPLLDFINAVISAIREFIEIVRLLIEIAFGLFVALTTWVFQVVALIVAIVTGFLSAAPTAIPGLPLCVSDPTSYDICAVYYATDWTILAQGTPGAFIVPIIVFCIDVSIVIFFGRRILKFLRSGEEVANVG
jgi:hypothetical protein